MTFRNSACSDRTHTHTHCSGNVLDIILSPMIARARPSHSCPVISPQTAPLWKTEMDKIPGERINGVLFIVWLISEVTCHTIRGDFSVKKKQLCHRSSVFFFFPHRQFCALNNLLMPFVIFRGPPRSHQTHIHSWMDCVETHYTADINNDRSPLPSTALGLRWNIKGTKYTVWHPLEPEWFGGSVWTPTRLNKGKAQPSITRWLGEDYLQWKQER